MRLVTRVVPVPDDLVEPGAARFFLDLRGCCRAEPDPGQRVGHHEHDLGDNARLRGCRRVEGRGVAFVPLEVAARFWGGVGCQSVSQSGQYYLS